jgi:hypothetical protein
MIRKSIIVAVVLGLSWSMAISFLPESMVTGQTTWGENLIAAQNYLFGDVSKNDMVIVGSSLSENLLVREISGHKVHNLGLSGQGPLDGLNVVLAADRLPGYVLVEMNVIMEAPNEQFEQVLLASSTNWVRKYVPALRQRYQPVGVFKGLVSDRSTADPTSQSGELLEDRPVNQLSLETKIIDYASPVPKTEIQAVLKELQARVQWLEERGTEVVFYEIPIHPQLCAAPKAVAIRTGFKEVFLPAKYTYIDQPDCSSFGTTDGHHLGQKSTARYSVWLERTLNDFLF